MGKFVVEYMDGTDEWREESEHGNAKTARNTILRMRNVDKRPMRIRFSDTCNNNPAHNTVVDLFPQV